MLVSSGELGRVGYPKHTYWFVWPKRLSTVTKHIAIKTVIFRHRSHTALTRRTSVKTFAKHFFNDNKNYNTPPLLCCGQITLSNIDEIWPLGIPNKISFISMHVPSMEKIS